MKYLPDEILNSLRTTFYVANTPQFLLKNFRERLLDYHNKYSIAEIYSEIISAAVKADKADPDNMVYLYALFAILTFGDYTKVRPLLEEIGKINLRWIDKLVYLYKSQARVSQSLSIQVPSPAVSSVSTVAIANNVPAYVSNLETADKGIHND